MKASITLFTLAIAVSLIAGCSYERSNKMVKGFNPSPWVDPGKPQTKEQKSAPPDEVEETPLEKIAEKAKAQHGLMHIHRYGEGYDILLTLDAGDSDVKFVMDLPKSESEKQSNHDGYSEQSAEEAATTAHSEAQGKVDDAEVDRIKRVDTMTKHILSAQSLFYKKEYWQALDETNEALEQVPDSAQAHALKGSIYYRMGLIPEARASWEQALELDPELDQVKASLARVR